MAATTNAPITGQWQQLTLTQKMLLGVTGILLVGLVLGVVSVLGTPEYKQIYGHLAVRMPRPWSRS